MGNFKLNNISQSLILRIISLTYAMVLAVNYSYWEHFDYSDYGTVWKTNTFVWSMIFCYILPTICYTIYVLSKKSALQPLVKRFRCHSFSNNVTSLSSWFLIFQIIAISK